MLDTTDYQIIIDALYIVAIYDGIDLSDEVSALSNDECERRLLALRSHFSRLQNKAKHQPCNDHAPSPIMQYFNYEHLPQQLQAVSKPIGDLAKQLDDSLKPSDEKSAGLRKLLEAKDCFVRASLT